MRSRSAAQVFFEKYLPCPSMLRKFLTLFTLALAINLVVMSIIWIHHLFVTGLNPFLASIFLLLSLLLFIPLVIYIVRRLTRYLQGKHLLSPATLFILGARIIIVAHLVDAVFVGNSALDISLPESSFGPKHFYTLSLLLVLFLGLACAYHFFPIIAHHSLNPTLGYLHFWVTMICAYILAYPPQHYQGLAGMPRRYIDYSPTPLYSYYYSFTNNIEFILLAAQGLFLVNLFYSTRRS
jgi:cytochrome c oxidase subunit 1